MAIMKKEYPVKRVDVKETRNGQPWIRTPCIQSDSLSVAAGCKVFAKLDLLQPSGSFKLRGIGNLILQKVREHCDPNDPQPRLHFFSCSRGNAGLAAGMAATRLNQRATVVVPEKTELNIISRIEATGAEVLVRGVSLSQADAFVRALVSAHPNHIYVPPFDHEMIWEGNSTVVDEIVAEWEGPPPDAVICSVGGGGLLNGIMRGLDRHGWGKGVSVLAVETEGADCLSQSLRAGEQVTMSEITSIARSLGVAKVSDQTWDLFQRRLNIRSLVLSDATAARACVRFAEDQKMIVESACGVCLATCYDDLLREVIPDFGPESRVVVIVCGGSNIDLATLVGWDLKYGRTSAGGEAVTIDGMPTF